MTDLFFYGTLRHPPLLELVMGDGARAHDLRAAILPDHAVRCVAEGPFPTLVAEPGAMAEGVLVRGLDAKALERLDFYEGGFDYDLVPVTLADGRSAQVYFSPPGRWTPGDPWSLVDWIAAHGEMNQHAAAEIMGYFGTKTRAEVAAILPRIRARAAAKVRAGQARHGAGTLQGRVQITSQSRVYGGFYAFDDLELRHERFDGTMTETLDRAVFIATDAALVLPYDPVRDRVMMVEQMRMGPLARGDRACWQMEPIAGMIDPGETPEQTVRREAVEEAGLELLALEPVAEVYASPGNATEFHYIFVGIADLPDGSAGIGGLESESEDIRSHVMDFEAFMEFIEGFQAANGPLVLAALWLARHRDRLRSGQGAATP